MNKKVGMHQPQRVENAKIMIANITMETDENKVKLLLLLFHL